ncbi:MAG: hypothetical protein JXQ96_19730 [Cyclobacteriaceae bacterium]
MKLHSLLFTILVSLLIACGGDGESPTDSCTGDPNFKNQTAQGSMDGNDWTFASGVAEKSTFEAGKLSVQLIDETFTDICDEFLFDGNVVIFTVDMATGVYKLCFSLGNNSNDVAQTLTLYDGTTNHIATMGAIEITSITDSEVSGRLDATADETSFVNGTFTVPLCQ